MRGSGRSGFSWLLSGCWKSRTPQLMLHEADDRDHRLALVHASANWPTCGHQLLRPSQPSDGISKPPMGRTVI